MKESKITILRTAAAVSIAISMIFFFLTGCSDNMQSEEEIVVPKGEMDVQEAEGEDGQSTGEGDEEAAIGGIAELVQAPEHYNWEGSSEGFTIMIDAPVIIPQAEGFKSYKVSSRVFTQEDYDKVNQVLLDNGKLWDRDFEAMQASNGLTVSEVDELIERFQIQKKAKETDEKTYDERIAQCETWKNAAPEEPVLVDIPAIVVYQERQSDEEYAGENNLYGNVTVNGEDYNVWLDNDLREDWRWISFFVNSSRELSNYYPAGMDLGEAVPEISTENVRQEAKKLMADMGFTDFAAAGEEYYDSVGIVERLGIVNEIIGSKYGYGIHFTRLLDGIPVTYTDSDGTGVEKDVVSAWPYEKIDIVFDEKGFTEFKWTNPYEIEKLSDEYVFLLPFSDIQKVFEEMFFKKCEDFWGDTQVEAEFKIDEVRLGYMRVMEKGEVTEGTMIPVWDFFGTETFRYDGMEESVTQGGPYNCLLTINAMDGTIIDRDLGY